MTPERQAALRAYGAQQRGPAAPVTGNSGTVVDPNTGGVLSQPGASTFVSQPIPTLGDTSGTQGGGSSPTIPYGWDAQTYAAFKAQNPTLEPTAEDTARMKAAGAMAVPSFQGNPLITNPQYEAAYNAYQAASTPGQQEIQAMTDKANLDASLRQAYTNTEGQPIALDFITGQKAAEQRSYEALSAPIEATLALAQAKRQLAMTASKTALDREQAKLSAAQELAKPVSTSYGGTMSRYNPTTGQYETIVNPFGTASGGGGADTTDVIGKAISEGRLSADQVTRYGIPFIASTLKSDPGYNFITQKASVGADTASLKEQQGYLDTTSRAFSTAQDNLKNLIGYMTTAGSINTSTVPLINDLMNKAKAGAIDPGAVAGFKAAISGLRAEYAQVLSRGGEVTDNARNSAAALIPDNISPAQLQQVADRLNVEGNNAIKEAGQKVSDIKARIGKSGSSSSGGAFSNTSSGTGSAANEGWF